MAIGIEVAVMAMHGHPKSCSRVLSSAAAKYEGECMCAAHSHALVRPHPRRGEYIK